MTNKKKLTSAQVAMLLDLLLGQRNMAIHEIATAASLINRGLISSKDIGDEVRVIITEQGSRLAKSIMGQANRLYRQLET